MSDVRLGSILQNGHRFRFKSIFTGTEMSLLRNGLHNAGFVLASSEFLIVVSYFDLDSLSMCRFVLFSVVSSV